MPIKINRGGASKPSTRKTTTSKPAVKRGSTAKTTPGRSAKPKASSTRAKSTTKPAARRGGPPKGPRPTAPEFKRYETKFQKAGEKVRKTREAHTEAVDELAALVAEGMEAGVPMSVIERSTGTARQWLYKINKTQKRAGTNGRGSRSTAKRAVGGASAAKASGKTTSKRSSTTTRKSGSRRVKAGK